MQRIKLMKSNNRLNDLQAQVKLLKDEYAQLYEDSFRDQEKARDAVEENNWLHDLIQEMQNKEFTHC